MGCAVQTLLVAFRKQEGWKHTQWPYFSPHIYSCSAPNPLSTLWHQSLRTSHSLTLDYSPRNPGSRRGVGEVRQVALRIWRPDGREKVGRETLKCGQHISSLLVGFSDEQATVLQRSMAITHENCPAPPMAPYKRKLLGIQEHFIEMKKHFNSSTNEVAPLHQVFCRNNGIPSPRASLLASVWIQGYCSSGTTHLFLWRQGISLAKNAPSRLSCLNGKSQGPASSVLGWHYVQPLKNNIQFWGPDSGHHACTASTFLTRPASLCVSKQILFVVTYSPRWPVISLRLLDRIRYVPWTRTELPPPRCLSQCSPHVEENT